MSAICPKYQTDRYFKCTTFAHTKIHEKCLFLIPVKQIKFKKSKVTKCWYSDIFLAGNLNSN
jgi:hypothetical protein